MGRQEPRFDKGIQDVEFRPRTYRGPSLPSPSRDSDAIAAVWAVDSGALHSGRCCGVIREGWLTTIPFPFKGLGGPTH